MLRYEGSHLLRRGAQVLKELVVLGMSKDYERILILSLLACNGKCRCMLINGGQVEIVFTNLVLEEGLVLFRET